MNTESRIKAQYEYCLRWEYAEETESETNAKIIG